MKPLLLSSVSILTLATSAFGQDLPQASSEWFQAGETTIQEILDRQPNTGRAKNIILLIADGNGVGTNYATRLYMGQRAGGFGEEYVLPYESNDFYSGLVKTYNINAQTPDSAPTAGAMNTGVKQRFNLINLGGDAVYDQCETVAGNELTTFAEIVTDMGKSVGIVSTARLTHATPAAAYAKTANRGWENAVPEGCTAQADIATQLVGAMEAGVIDVALGGGMREFLPEGTGIAGMEGRRADGTNLIETAQGMGVVLATDTDSFNALPRDGSTPLLGLFEASHMQYETDRTDEPSLAEMTAAAIETLSQNDEGYFLQIEAGRVDHGNHAGNLARAVSDGAAFADAVALADEMTNDEDTLIIVTADHEHAIAFNGYCGRGSDILGLCYGVSQTGEVHSDEPRLANDGKPYTVAGYLNGPGTILEGDDYEGARPEVTQEEAVDVDYIQQSFVPTGGETHSGEDVAIYAKGPWAHLVDGTMEQNVIFHVMNYAAKAE